MSDRAQTPHAPDVTGVLRFASPGHSSLYRCPRSGTQATSLLGWRRRRFQGLQQYVCAGCFKAMADASEAKLVRLAAEAKGGAA